MPNSDTDSDSKTLFGGLKPAANTEGKPKPKRAAAGKGDGRRLRPYIGIEFQGHSGYKPQQSCRGGGFSEASCDNSFSLAVVCCPDHPGSVVPAGHGPGGEGQREEN